MKKCFLILPFLVIHFFAEAKIPPLSDMMSIEDQKRTGAIRLKQHERKELAKWIYEHCHKEESKRDQNENYLQISLNIDGGKKLQLSDNSIWEIDPSDVKTSSSWISDINVRVFHSGDQEYPFLIVNTRTQKSVRARKSSSL